MSDEWDGLLAIDKPAGPTSHDLVARVRTAIGSRRVGHTGTLDPSATGLLLLVLGNATRLARFVPDAPKAYQGELVLGITTTTDDIAGDVVSRHVGPLPVAEVVISAAAGYLGAQRQVPPAFSARQVNGTRLYRSARRGIVLDAPATEIVVDRFEVAPSGSAERFSYRMVVSTGTYVRAIVRDLGRALGCGAAVASLRRTAIGPFNVDEALFPPAEREALLDAVRRHLIPVDAMPLDLPSIALGSPFDAMRFAAGGVVTMEATVPGQSALTAVRDDGGRLLGVGQRGDGTLRPRTVLPWEPNARPD